MKRLALIIVLTFNFFSIKAQNCVVNNSFEMPPQNGRPPYWYIGFNDTPEIYQQLAGSWELDSNYFTTGMKSLKLTPTVPSIPGLDFIGYSFTQFLDVPTYDIADKTITVSVDMRQNATYNRAPECRIVLINPADTINTTPQMPLPNEGYLILTADSNQVDTFITYTGNFTASGNGSALLLMLTTNKDSGSAWFDNLVVRVPYDTAGAAVPIPAPVVSKRCYKMGFTANDPYNISEPAYERLFRKMSNASEVYNAFFSVKWTSFTGKLITDAHKKDLELVDRAKSNGLDIMLTFDFTHTSNAENDTLGYMNHTPGKTSEGGNKIVGTFKTDSVATAYKAELLSLCAIIQPAYVMVGIETSLYYDNYGATDSTEWDAYVNLYKQITDTLQLLYPGIHVSPYFIASWMISPGGVINQSHAYQWKKLLPQLPGIAWSFYNNIFNEEDSTYIDGYFTKLSTIVPGLPLMFPEFGFKGSDNPLDSIQFSLTGQAQFLERFFQELDTVNVELISYYSVYDQTFYTNDISMDYIMKQFKGIGLHEQNGMEKPIWGVWQAMFDLGYDSLCSPASIKEKNVNRGIFVYPNPYSTTATFYIPNEISNQNNLITIYDVLGNLIKTIHTNRKQEIIIHRDGLKNGVYLYRLLVNNQFYNAGKLIIQ